MASIRFRSPPAFHNCCKAPTPDAPRTVTGAFRAARRSREAALSPVARNGRLKPWGDRRRWSSPLSPLPGLASCLFATGGSAAARLAPGYLLTAARRLRASLGSVLESQNRRILALFGPPVRILHLVPVHTPDEIEPLAEIGVKARRTVIAWRSSNSALAPPRNPLPRPGGPTASSRG